MPPSIAALSDENTACPPTKILVVDDHMLVLHGMSHLIAGTPSLNAVALEAASLEDADRQLATHPDTELAILDLSLPGTAGCETLRHFARHHPALPFIVISASNDPAIIQEAVSLGARSYIPKLSPITVIVAAIQLSLAGGNYLPPSAFLSPAHRRRPSPAGIPEHHFAAAAKPMLERLSQRHRDVLNLLLAGKNNQEIAACMNLSVGTIKHYVSALLRQCGIKHRTQLIIHLKLHKPGSQGEQ